MEAHMDNQRIVRWKPHMDVMNHDKYLLEVAGCRFGAKGTSLTKEK